MRVLTILILLVIAPAISIYIGCLGIEMIERTALGWVLLLIGVAYPAGAILYYYRYRAPLKRWDDRTIHM
jgi:hypothetical protein